MRSFHRECFATPCLAVCKYSGVVPFDHLGYKARDAQALVNVGLIVLGSEYLIEVVYLPPIHLRLVHHLRLILTRLHHLNLVVSAYY